MEINTFINYTKFKKIRIFYDRINDKRFLPFDLFIYSVNEYLSDYLNSFVIFFNDINEVFKNEENEDDDNKNEPFILMMFLNDLNKLISAHGNSVNNINNLVKIVFIHTDFIKNHSQKDQDDIKLFLNDINSSKCVIWEYSSQNIYEYNKYYPNVRYFFLPLLYSNFLETFYNSYLENRKIPYENKDIDIVFIGSCSERRKKLLNVLEKKYRVITVDDNNDYGFMINLMERTKIYINLFCKETNKAFDYYRLSLLFANKVFVITEIPKLSFKIEKNLLELAPTLIMSNYSDFLNKVDEYYNKSPEEIETIVNRTYNAFIKYPLYQSLNEFFEI